MRLHDYQQRGAEFVCGQPASYLAMDVGLGKSATVLRALDQLFDQFEVLHTLVVAPKRVAEHTWPEQASIWSPTRSLKVIAGSPAERMRAVMGPEEIKVIGRDNLPWLIEQFSDRWPFDVLVIDEAQGFKDSSSKRFKQLRKVRKHFDRVILMSATPASESLMGLWSQVYLLDAGQRLGRSFSAFKQAFFDADYMGWNFSLRTGAEQEIMRRIEDVFYTLRAEDYLELPERIDNLIALQLSNTEMATYRQLEREYLLPMSSGEQVTAANAAVLVGKLLQLSGGACYDQDKQSRTLNTVKLDALEELIDSANGQPVLVFYGYSHELDRIKARIKGAEELDVAKWNAGQQRVVLAHPASAGAGLNLQAGGSVICWYSLPWSLELYTQANGRLHRQGQTRNVVIHHLIVEGTVDEDVLAALRDKDAGQERLLNTLKRRTNDGR